jgi:hypothetical protein
MTATTVVISPPARFQLKFRRLSRPNKYNFDLYSVRLLRIDYWSVLTKVGLPPVP